jgi:hypothetical protein
MVDFDDFLGGVENGDFGEISTFLHPENGENRVF